MSNQCFAFWTTCLSNGLFVWKSILSLELRTSGLEILIVQSPSVSYQIGIEHFFEILCLLSGNTIFALIYPFPLSHFSPKCLKIALHTCKPDIVHFVQYNCIEINIFFFCLPFLCSPKIQPQVRYFQLNIYFGVYCRQKICHDIF